MKYKIVEKDNIHAVHSNGYYGEDGKKKAQDLIDTGYCHKYWSDKDVDFIVIEDKKHETSK